jgi:hypothetical protein
MPTPSANVRFIPRQAIKGIHKFVGSESQAQQPEKVARRRHEHKSEDANTDSIERSEAANNLTNAPKGEEEDAKACQKPYALERSNATCNGVRSKARCVGPRHTVRDALETPEKPMRPFGWKPRMVTVGGTVGFGFLWENIGGTSEIPDKADGKQRHQN